MTRTSRNLLALVIVFVLAIACLWWRFGGRGEEASPLAVTFVGWTNNPSWTPPPNRIELGRSATGRCALFWVTNAGHPRERVWFDTSKVEQKVGNEWREFVPANTRWSGVEGSIWMGGYGCHYAVGIPPGMPTNAVWRLQVRCGRDRSSLKLAINSWLKRELFRKSTGYVVFSSSEVIP